MNKILLVYEDYADLMNVESTLKKVGFDVIGLTNEYTVAEQVLAFNPDLVIGSGRGGKVSSLGVGKRLKEMHRWQGKSVLIFQPNIKPDPQDLIRIRVDMVLEAPVPALRLMQVAAKLLGHDESVLQARLNKGAAEAPGGKSFSLGTLTAAGGKFNTDSEAIYIKGRTEDVERNAEERALRAEKIQNEEGVNFSLKSEAGEDGQKMSFRFGDRMSTGDTPTVRKEASGEASMFADVDLKALEREILGGGAPQVDRIEVDASGAATSEDGERSEEASALEPDSVAAVKAAEATAVNATEEEELAADSEPAALAEDSAVMISSNTAEDLAAAAEAAGASEDVVVNEDSVYVTGEAAELREIQAKARAELQNAEKALKNRVERYARMVADVKVAPKSTVSRVEARRRQKQIAAEWDQENLKELDDLRREFTKALFKK